ncbi:MAG: (1--_2) glucan export composite transrane/ATP-binding protein [Candidatus Saccharibacteria bacterium]|nr:(1-->2) glucan export composite transrane/ATP-binding protein [Candidatus Saccharibacteria bacterium]
MITFTKELWRYYAGISVLTVLASLTTVVVPLLSGWAIEEIRKGAAASIKHVIILALLLFIMDVLGNILNNINGYYGDQLSAKLNKLLAVRYFEHLLDLPQKFFDTELTGKLTNRLNRSVMQISNFVQAMTNNFMQFIFSTIFALVIVAFYSWPVALMLLSLYPLYIWLTIKSSDTWQSYQKDKNEQYDIANGRFTESIAQVKVIKSFIQEKHELGFFTRHTDKAVQINVPQSKYWHKRDVRRRLLLNVIFLAVYSYIFVTAVHGSISPGVAVALILYAQQIRIPIFTISFLVDSTQRAMADSKDYFDIMSIEPEIADHDGSEPIKLAGTEIVFKDVSFGYDDKHMVLNGLDFTVSQGTKVALVGESGEGKTTITNLLMRLYEPQQGTITIGGTDINTVTQKSLRQQIGVVFQDPALFSGTIRENIAYSNQSASEAEVIAAAKAANAHEFISEFEKSYDTQIGERGLKLSGGQKQRIAIARALLKDAPILILDEATSSLDSRSEVMVQEALERLMHGRTTIIIAHRLSTIQSVDQIITISQGRVDEVGSPHELAKTKGIYAQLLSLQNREPTEKTREQLKEFEIAG